MLVIRPTPIAGVESARPAPWIFNIGLMLSVLFATLPAEKRLIVVFASCIFGRITPEANCTENIICLCWQLFAAAVASTAVPALMRRFFASSMAIGSGAFGNRRLLKRTGSRLRRCAPAAHHRLPGGERFGPAGAILELRPSTSHDSRLRQADRRARFAAPGLCSAARPMLPRSGRRGKPISVLGRALGTALCSISGLLAADDFLSMALVASC